MSQSLKKYIVAIISSVFVSQSFACTAVTLIAPNKNVVSGRTMEWTDGWNWKVIYMPKNTSHVLTAPAGLNLAKHSYKSKYSILGTGIVQDKHMLLIDGQNSQGLSLSANYLPGFTQYQKVTKDDTQYASILESTTFILSQFSTTSEAKASLKNYKIWSDKSTEVSGIAPEVHFLITDRSGHGLVVEYVDGKLKLYDLKSNVNVMTNAPTYDWHLTNLRNYLNLNNKTITAFKIDDIPANDNNSIQDINGLGQGNGFLGLPGDYSSPSRFIKAATLSFYSNNEGPKDENTVSKVAHILHNVDIAKGTVVDKVGNELLYDHTAYVVIKDLNNNTLYLTSYDKPLNSVKINLNDLDKNKVKYFDKSITDLPTPNNDITSSFE